MSLENIFYKCYRERTNIFNYICEEISKEKAIELSRDYITDKNFTLFHFPKHYDLNFHRNSICEIIHKKIKLDINPKV